ncbi:hypothetical protein PHYSODRAFT_334075 [Phytophthora sojae]|uniref:Uncharacterized protein n=1 Tax=Phytophthora sojae (strain P6497) TaxID=1094619 RepID=G4ZQL0_PHYSP|nr:hypothetical protein PHYSODRAFT_334075 [Phytophthora sojae]EGZ15867.1 hypothetical protein PHYSODRAFT_334075 [Phytophthora sojae]|eukprot:XP_009529616.1 hypothetical protein PHYSODRAFT_334075 [Phytophthora sojae]
MNWTLKEQNLLVTACEHALRVHPSESLAEPSRPFLDSVHGYFVTLSGSSKRSERATTTKLKQLAKSCVRWKSTQQLSQRAGATRKRQKQPRRAGGGKKLHEALSTLAQKHATLLDGVTPIDTQLLSSGAVWTVAELERLVRAYVDVRSRAGSGRSPGVGKKLCWKYLELGGDTGRTQEAMTTMFRLMLKAREFVLAIGSWSSWLLLSDMDRRNRSQHCGKEYKFLLPRMNEAMFRSLDEAAALSDKASYVSRDASRDTEGEGVLGNQEADPGVHQGEAQSSMQVAPLQGPDNNIMEEEMPSQEELEPEGGSQLSVANSSATMQQEPSDETMEEEASTGEEREPASESEPQGAVGDNSMAATPHDSNDGATSAEVLTGGGRQCERESVGLTR